MQEILLVGGGGHARAVIDVIEQEKRYKIAGIIDREEFIGSSVMGYKVIGCDSDLKDLYPRYQNAIVTVGQIRSNHLRVSLFNLLKEIGYNLPVIVSPLAYLSRHSSVNEGSVVMHHALINANVQVGRNCIINTKALLEHDVVVKDHCHISTASVLNGGVVIEQSSFFGSNATSKESVELQGFIKAGSVAK